MQYLTTTLVAALAALVAAAPPTTINPRANVEASVNWFKRWDCRDDCVEIGMCLSGQEYRGTGFSTSDWIGWDAGCWDRPDGIHSLALSVNNGHKFSAINQDCKTYTDKKNPGYNKDGFKSWPMDVADFEAGHDKGYHHCNVFSDEKAKAVIYHW